MATPRLAVLAVGAALVMLAFVLALLATDDIWIIVVTILAMAAIATFVYLDVFRVFEDSDAWDAGDRDRRAVVVTSEPFGDDEVSVCGLSGQDLDVMVVAPEGFAQPHHRDGYERARAIEGDAVAALRRAGIRATGHVGDHEPMRAIADALALFPAARVVVVARGDFAGAYREAIDAAATKATVEFIP